MKLPVPTSGQPMDLFKAGVAFGVTVYALLKEKMKGAQ